MTNWRPWFFGFFYVCSLFLEGCGQAVSREVMATVFQTEGEISLAPDRKSSLFAQSEKDSCLHVGDKLKTSAVASIDFSPVPGALVRLSGNSELLIEKLRVAKDGNRMVDAMKSRDVRLRLIRGTLSVVIGEAGRNLHTVISTPTGCFFARSGSTFRLEVTDGKTRATCVRGKVTFETEEADLRAGIGAGYFHEWPATSPVPRLAAESDAQTQAEVALLLEVERKLLSLEQQERAEPLRRGSDDEGGTFPKILKYGSRQRLQLFSQDDHDLQRSRVVGGSCCSLLDRYEPGFAQRRDCPRRIRERRAERQRSPRQRIHKCSFVCRDPGKGQAPALVRLGCRHPAA